MKLFYIIKNPFNSHEQKGWLYSIEYIQNAKKF